MIKNQRTKTIIAYCLVLCLVATSLTACSEREAAVVLADSGITTGDVLAQFYDGLAQDVIDTWETDAYLTVTKSDGLMALDPRIEEEYQITISALKYRAQMARDLSALYSALKSLSSYNASEEARTAAGNLAEKVTAIPLLNPGVNISGLVKEVVGTVQEYRRIRDIRKSSDKIERLLKAVVKVVESETDFKDESGKSFNAYASVVRGKNSKMGSLLKNLLENKQVLSRPLIEGLLKSLSITFSDKEGKADSEEVRIKAAAAIVEARIKRLEMTSGLASANIKQALAGLIDNHVSLREKRGLNLSNVTTTLQRAQVFLAEANKIRTQNAEKQTALNN